MNDKVIYRLTRLGVSLFRINLSHTAREDIADVIRFVQSRTDVPVCLDSEGAQIRTAGLATESVDVVDSSFIRICRDPVPGDSEAFNLHPRDIVAALEPGDFITIDFNSVLVQVIETDAAGALARVINGGRIGRNKAVTVQRHIPLPAMTEKDRAAVAIGRKMGIRHFALSFASSAGDVDEMRSLIGDDAFCLFPKSKTAPASATWNRLPKPRMRS